MYRDGMQKTTQTNLLEDFVKQSLPSVNLCSYNLKSLETVPNDAKYQTVYKERLVITIEDQSEYPWEDKHLWQSHWFVETQYQDRPIRAKAVTIIVRTKKRRNKETGKIYTSKVEWYTVVETTRRTWNQLDFLKYDNWSLSMFAGDGSEVMRLRT
jgi:hypothetical protein